LVLAHLSGDGHGELLGVWCVFGREMKRELDC
jgi:hypothetical protein